MRTFHRSNDDAAPDPAASPSPGPAVAPRYCPRCQRPAPPSTRGDGSLCNECGDTLRDQGYCRVCERFWPAAPGTACPKHEIELDPGPPPRHPVFADGAPVSWVTVARFEHPTLAQAPRLRLDAEGIPTFLDGERMGTESAYNTATGGVRLQVPAPLAAEARVILDQRFAAPAAHDPDDLDDAWDELGGHPAEARRSVMRVLIVVILALPALQALVFWLHHWLRR